jgi:hypothetical protein
MVKNSPLNSTGSVVQIVFSASSASVERLPRVCQSRSVALEFAGLGVLASQRANPSRTITRGLAVGSL